MSQATETIMAPKFAPSDMELYLLRDELAETHEPRNIQERQLVTAIAQNWLRYQDALRVEQELMSSPELRQILLTRLDLFKAVTRHATDCERAWRHCVTRLEIMKRRRPKTLASPEARRSWNRLEGKLPPDKPLQSVYTSVMQATPAQLNSIRKHQRE
ncbi:MAG: hypothetical protein JSU00_29350 [Acidobacteria bacterium]|nr:hypothetical protein [Acidobacteriota bacterium]